jgi:hypothetical protein
VSGRERGELPIILGFTAGDREINFSGHRNGDGGERGGGIVTN